MTKSSDLILEVLELRKQELRGIEAKICIMTDVKWETEELKSEWQNELFSYHLMKTCYQYLIANLRGLLSQVRKNE